MHRKSDNQNYTPILFIAHQTGVAANGGIKSLNKIIEGLTLYRPIIITNRETPITLAWKTAGIPVFIVPICERGWALDPAGTFSTYVAYFRVVKSILQEYNIPLIHANDPLVYQLALPIAKLMGRKIVLNLRDTLAPNRSRPRLRYFLNFSTADHVFYLSREMSCSWARVSKQAKSYSVTYSVSEVPKDVDPRPPKGPKRVLVSGSIRSDKGQLEILRSVAPRIVSEGIAIDFAGDLDAESDSYAAECIAAAKPFGDMVRFLGYRIDISSLYRDHHVTLIASHHEGLARAMIESMAHGRPVVSVDVCSAREILECKSNGAGKVVQMGDWDGLAREVIKFCRNCNAAETAGRYGIQTSKELFATSRVVAAYENVYDRLLGRSR